MSGKALKPTLSGTRNKTRKRDERERYEPSVFRDSIIYGLEDVGNKPDLILRYLIETATNKLDVKRYGETLLDVLFVGGIIAPGGTIEGGVQTEICLAKQDKEDVAAFANIFIQFIRRYKWLQKSLAEEIRKIIMVMRVCLNETEREKLGSAVAHFLIEGIIPPNLLSGLTQDHLLKDELSAHFATSLFRTWLAERDMASLTSTLKKATLDPSLQDLFPPPKRSSDHIQAFFEEHGLNEMVQHVKSQRAQSNRRVFMGKIKMFLNEEKPLDEIVLYIKDTTEQGKITISHAIQILFSTIVNNGQWSGSQQIPDGFYKYIKEYVEVFKAIIGTNEKLQIETINKVQEFCYDNIEFIKTFQKIIFMFYQSEVLAEEAIIQWYKNAHSSKGQTQFMAQMEKMVEWLENAEEEESDEDEN